MNWRVVIIPQLLWGSWQGLQDIYEHIAPLEFLHSRLMQKNKISFCSEQYQVGDFS